MNKFRMMAGPRALAVGFLLAALAAALTVACGSEVATSTVAAPATQPTTVVPPTARPATTVPPTTAPATAQAPAPTTVVPTRAPTAQPTATSAPAVALRGNIEIDGSSTVFPITQAVAEEFRKTNGAVQVPVGISGTGGGFKRFVVGEIDIADASRPISTTEKESALKNGIEYIEFKVAFDGLSVMVHPGNKFVTCLTTAELKKITDTGSTVLKWNQVRPEFPNQDLWLYGPGSDSGTFDYFTEVINGKAKQHRVDYTPSEDDNILVRGVSGDDRSIGYFGFAYFEQNKDKLKLVSVDGGKGCVLPSKQTIEDGTYSPLSRPLYIYVNKKSMARPEVKAFVEYYLKNAAVLSAEVGYVALPQALYDEGLAKLN